jgi:NADPH-dependent ferric siderophore reductase
MPALLLAETDSPSTRQPLPDTGDAEFRWLYREGAPAGSTTLLEDALAAERLTPDVFVWAAAEHRTVDALREVARTARVARTHRSLLAYWRLPTAR